MENETQQPTSSSKRIIILVVGAALALLLACGGAAFWFLGTLGGFELPEEAYVGDTPDEALVGELETLFPTYEVLGYDYGETSGANLAQGPGSEYVTQKWQFALAHEELPGKPLVVSFVRVHTPDFSPTEWNSLDEFFAGGPPSDTHVSLAGQFEQDHPGESLLGAYEIESAGPEQRVYRVGYHRPISGGWIESEYTYVLDAGQWSQDEKSEYPDLRWGTLRPELEQ